MNTTAMRQVGAYILAEPRRFNMSALWIESNVCEEHLPPNHAKKATPPCGTVACFAGEWALMDGSAYYPTVALRCQKALALPNDDLFYHFRWPGRLQTELKAGTDRYAKYFVKVVLEDYIATNGWENEP